MTDRYLKKAVQLVETNNVEAIASALEGEDKFTGMVNEEACDRNILALVVKQKDALSVANHTLRKALQDVVNGNDRTLERGESRENWRNSAFRKQAVAAIHGNEQYYTAKEGP